jgi:hypothetical protein
LSRLLKKEPWELEPGFSLCSQAFEQARLLQVAYNEKIKSTHPGRGLELRPIDPLVAMHYANQNKKVLVTNIHLRPGLLDSCYYSEFLPSWYGMYSGDVAIESHPTVKSFNCFMSRIDPFRQSWAYLLIRRGLWNQGYISFCGKPSPNDRDDLSMSPEEILERNLQKNMLHFSAEHEILKKQVPYCNFDDSNLNKVIMNSTFSIVIETCAKGGLISFSEKIMRHLKLPRPWVLFTSQYGVKHLKQIGFDVLDDVVDHSYDNILHNAERQSRILDIAESMCNLQINSSLQQRLETAAIHNQQLLTQLYTTFDQDLEKTFVEAYTKCLAL